MNLLVVLEQRAGKWNRVSFEALAAARRLAEAASGEVAAALLGSDIGALAQEAATFPVAKVYAIENPLLGEYTPDGYAAAIEQLVSRIKPDAVVFPHTYEVRDYAPKISTRFGQPLISDVVDLKPSPNGAVFVRQLFQGKLNADVRSSAKPEFISVQAGAFRAAEPVGESAAVENFVVNLEPSQIRSKPEAPFQEAQRSVDLTAAETIVAVGRGIKDKDNLAIVEGLASALGAELAASRPICDNGWLPMERQVGSSGQTVAPKLYVAVGVSGAIQHLVGMKGSKTVVAINKDESAPIFELADYGIVGDLFEVVPALTEEVNKIKS